MFIIVLKEASALLRKNLNLAQLIFIFFIIATLFFPSLYGVKVNFRILPVIVFWYALFCAFFAGVFFAFKKAIDYRTDPPKNENPYGLSPLYFAEFFQGIGMHFYKFLLAGLIVVFLLFVFGFGYDYIVSHYVAMPEVFSKIKSVELLTNDAKLMEFINSLSPHEQLKIAQLGLFTFAVAALWGYITMLYPVSLVSTDGNIFKALWDSLKCLVKDLPVSLFIFLFFNIGIFFATLISSVAVSNIIISVLAILLQCYLNVWYILSLFVYYEKVK